MAHTAHSKAPSALPQNALPDLKKLAELEDGLFDQFLAAIAESGPSLTSGQLEKSLLHKVPRIKPDDVHSVIRVVFYLYSIMRGRKTAFSPKEMAEAVINAPFVTTSTAFSKEIRDRLSQRLIHLLSFPKSMGVSSKALEIMTKNERNFCKASIISDIRPVFADTPDTADAAVIIHTLQIGFHQNGHHQDLYITLDMNDISALKALIERAEKKDVALQAILRKAHLPNLE